MITFIVAAVSVSQVPVQDALARYAALATGSGQLTAEFTVKESSARGTGSGKLELNAPDMQAFSLKWDGESFEFRHSRLGGLAIRHDRKEYDQTPAYPGLVSPPPMIMGQAEIGYPFILLSNDLNRFAREGEWASQGKESVRGATCDKLYLDQPDIGGGNTIWIDRDGRIRRWRRQYASVSGRMDITFNFTRYESSVPTRVSHYSPTLPLGYVPNKVPGTRTTTRVVGLDPAAFGNWLNMRTGEHDDVKEMADGVRVALVFTAPECEISGKIEPFLDKLRKRLKAFNCALVEVSLGRTEPAMIGKDKDRPVYWDKLGSIERAYGIPVTPYFLVADETGRLIRGWQGHAPDMEDKIIETLVADFVKG